MDVVDCDAVSGLLEVGTLLAYSLWPLAALAGVPTIHGTDLIGDDDGKTDGGREQQHWPVAVVVTMD
jgi:hypothetical protein